MSEALKELEENHSQQLATLAEAWCQDRLKLRRLNESLTPSAETKAAYSGEFSFDAERTDYDGNQYCETIMVPWSTIKEIMKFIASYAAENPVSPRPSPDAD